LDLTDENPERPAVTSRRIFIVAIVALQLGVVVAAVSAQPTTLSSKDIEDAILLGWYHDPQPYLLRGPGKPGMPTSDGRTTVGAIYTPFVRVALASKAARLAARRYESGDVSQKVLEPVVYVVLRWYCCDHEQPDPTTFDARRTSDHKIMLPGELRIVAGAVRVTARPLWVSKDLSVLGADPPFADAVLVAAYPLSVLTSGHDFVIYREGPKTEVPSPAGPPKWWNVRVGRLVDTEVARWR
jgi:hypothetical protein